MKQFIVVGLGRFGLSVTKTLLSMGYEVLAIDKDPKKVQECASFATDVYRAEATDEKTLLELGVHNMDHAIVAIGDDLQANILATIQLKNLGVKTITAKAVSDLHHKVLEKLGVDHIIHPERDTGVRVAHQITSQHLIEFLEVAPEYSLVEIYAPPSMCGKSLKQLKMRASYGCNIIAIRTKDNQMNISPTADDQISHGDILVIIGSNKGIAHLEKKYVRTKEMLK